MEFVQKKLFSKRILTIENAELKINELNWFSSHERLIPIDEISPYWEKIEDKRDNISLIIILTFIFLLIVFMNEGGWIFFVLVLAFVVLIRRMFSSSIISLKVKNQSPIVLDKKNPSTKEVETFLNALFQKQKEYLKWKYGTLDADLDFDIQITNFRRLRNMGILSDPEYDQLKHDLKEIIKKSS